MIHVNERDRSIECTQCGQIDGVSQRAIETPAALQILVDRMARDHAGCNGFTPERARAERQWRERMAAEMRGIA